MVYALGLGAVYLRSMPVSGQRLFDFCFVFCFPFGFFTLNV